MKPGENYHKNFGTNEIQMNIKYLCTYFLLSITVQSIKSLDWKAFLTRKKKSDISVFNFPLPSWIITQLTFLIWRCISLNALRNYFLISKNKTFDKIQNIFFTYLELLDFVDVVLTAAVDEGILYSSVFIVWIGGGLRLAFFKLASTACCRGWWGWCDEEWCWGG